MVFCILLREIIFLLLLFFFFFFNDTATTEIYTLSLHDALPIPRTRDLVAPSMPSSSPAMVAAAVERKRRRSWLMLTSRCLLDHPRHHGRMRKERHVARFDLGRLRVHAFGVEALEIGIDGFVVLRHDVP